MNSLWYGSLTLLDWKEGEVLKERNIKGYTGYHFYKTINGDKFEKIKHRHILKKNPY